VQQMGKRPVLRGNLKNLRCVYFYERIKMLLQRYNILFSSNTSFRLITDIYTVAVRTDHYRIPDTALCIDTHLPEKQIPVLQYPLCSPDLAPCNYFAFRKLLIFSERCNVESLTKHFEECDSCERTYRKCFQS
jgi:hypothetical protein